MLTTIIVNGSRGSRFLAVLRARFSGHLPPPLAFLVSERGNAVEVDTELAEEIAELVERIAEPDDEPPLLFSPNIGEGVAIVRDLLVEVQTPARRHLPRVWRFVARGTRGRVLAHPESGRRGPAAFRVLLEPSREVAYVRPCSMTGTRYLLRR